MRPPPQSPRGKRANVAVCGDPRDDPRAPPPRSALETRVQALETQQQAELASLRGEKERLRRLLGRQSGALAGLERSLRAASGNSSLLQRQQRQLLESVQRLVRVVAQGPGERAGCLRGVGGGQERRGRSCLPCRLAFEVGVGVAQKPLWGGEGPGLSPSTCETEITTSNDSGEDECARRNQSRLYLLTL